MRTWICAYLGVAAVACAEPRPAVEPEHAETRSVQMRFKDVAVPRAAREYVPVTMHRPARDNPVSAESADDAPEIEGRTWRRSSTASPLPITPVGGPSTRMEDDDKEDSRSSLERLVGSEGPSGWGWLADGVYERDRARRRTRGARSTSPADRLIMDLWREDSLGGRDGMGASDIDSLFRLPGARSPVPGSAERRE